MGEGGTPLTDASRLGAHLGHEHLLIKNETVNPTLSFKDRPLSVGLTKAVEFGVERIVAASTGNTAVAASAYAARAGIPCTIFVPAGTPREKTALMRLYGGEVEEVAGSFSDAYEKAFAVAREPRCFNVTSTYLNPFACEGDKTLAYELFEDLGAVPDWIVIPVGAGPLLAYCYKGFQELRAAGVTDRLPRMAAVQAEGCAPIARAFADGVSEVSPWGEPRTIAGGVADPLTTYPRDGTRTLAVVRDSGGCVLSIPEGSIPRSVALLATHEGIFAEPAAALPVAALEEMHRAGGLKPDERVVSVVTGHGLKDMAATGAANEQG
jgi:threonine synthase